MKKTVAALALMLGLSFCFAGCGGQTPPGKALEFDKIAGYTDKMPQRL